MRKRSGWWLGVALAFCLNTAFAQSTAVFNVNKFFDPVGSETPVEIELVDPDTGCSLEELCPCEGNPDSNEPWKNQGQYLKCVKDTIGKLEEFGVISHFEGLALFDEARTRAG